MSKKLARPTGVYTAGDTVKMTLAQIEHRRVELLEKRAVYGLFGIAELDNYVIPLWPGDLMYVTALPSNGKSFVCRMFEKRVVDLLLHNDDQKRVAVWITTEESTEKIGAHWLAGMSGISSTDMLSGRLTQEQQVTMNASVSRVGSWPLYVIGHSISKRDAKGIQNPSRRLSRSEIDKCIDYIVNKRQKDIVFLTLDYIHRVRNDGRGDREEHIRQSVDWTRDIANWISAPVVVAAQAKAKVGDRKYAMPGIPDVEWSMNAGQSADALIGLWFPKTSIGVGGLIEKFGKYENLVVTESMMFVGVAKQKDGRGGDVFLLDVKPHLMEWEILEMASIDLNPHTTKQKQLEEQYSNDGGYWPSVSQGEINF